jgi:hypothetical protein
MQGSISLRVKYSRERTHRRNLFRHVKKERKKSKVAERFAISPKRGKNHKAPKKGRGNTGEFKLFRDSHKGAGNTEKRAVEAKSLTAKSFFWVWCALCRAGLVAASL